MKNIVVEKMRLLCPPRRGCNSIGMHAMRCLAGFFLLGTISVYADGTIARKAVLNADVKFQKIDGFGVNITPAQWRDGNLKPVLDMLVDDLGCMLFRFDCYGTADWLDPNKRDKDGNYHEEHLKDVYTGKVFKDAWETFRYLNTRGIEPYFNVSGKIPRALVGTDGQTLKDFDGYAEMAVSMLKWAREKEHLKFSLFAPFNETDLGFPEGPRLQPNIVIPATKAILKKLDEAGLGDIKLIVLCDAYPKLEKIAPICKDASMVGRLAYFSTHTYGDGGDQEPWKWFQEETDFAKFAKMVRQSPYNDCPVWLSEFGDLDQTGEVEFGVGWRCVRRLLKAIDDGFSSGQVWDAFDNFHEHDGAWATYGIFKTDRDKWIYTPKRRYYALKQVFQFVKPGFVRIEIKAQPTDTNDVYAGWHAPLKHIPLYAFVSPDGNDFTIVGMSTVESDIQLDIGLKGINIQGKTVAYYRTSRNEDCVKIADLQIDNMIFSPHIKENSIFTLTTLK